jgi:hypothetical protein
LSHSEACVEGSMMSGERDVELRMTTAFCADSPSAGSPSAFHLSISLSELRKRVMSKSSTLSAVVHSWG